MYVTIHAYNFVTSKTVSVKSVVHCLLVRFQKYCGVKCLITQRFVHPRTIGGDSRDVTTMICAQIAPTGHFRFLKDLELSYFCYAPKNSNSSFLQRQDESQFPACAQ